MAPPPGIPTTPGGGPPHHHQQQGRQGRGGQGKGGSSNSGKGGSSNSGKGGAAGNSAGQASPSSTSSASSSSSSSSSSLSTHPSLSTKPYALMLVSEGLARVDRKFKPGIASLANDHGLTYKETHDLLEAQRTAMAAKKVTLTHTPPSFPLKRLLGIYVYLFSRLFGNTAIYKSTRPLTLLFSHPSPAHLLQGIWSVPILSLSTLTPLFYYPFPHPFTSSLLAALCTVGTIKRSGTVRR